MPGPASTIGCDAAAPCPTASPSSCSKRRKVLFGPERHGADAIGVAFDAADLAAVPQVPESHNPICARGDTAAVGTKCHGHDRRGMSRSRPRSLSELSDPRSARSCPSRRNGRAAVRAEGQTEDLHVGTREHRVQLAATMSQSRSPWPGRSNLAAVRAEHYPCSEPPSWAFSNSRTKKKKKKKKKSSMAAMAGCAAAGTRTG